MLALSLALPILFGIAAADRLCTRAGLSLRANPCLVAGTGILVGLGLTSVLDYVLLVAFAGADETLVRADMVLVLLAAALAWWKAPSRWRTAATDGRPVSWLVMAAVAVPALGRTLLGFGDGAFVALVVAATVLAPRRPTIGDGTLALAVSLALLAGYYLVFVTMPQNLQWHLRTALERVVLQAWPTIVLAALLVHRRAAT